VYGTRCSQNRLVSEVSHTPLAGFHIATGFSREQSGDVFEIHERRSEFINRPRYFRPQSGAVSLAESFSCPCQTDILAGETRSQDVNWLYSIIAYFPQVTEVSHPGEVLLQDDRAGRVIIRNPAQVDFPEHFPEGNLDAAVAGTQ
jgi:hypothetical protein